MLFYISNLNNGKHYGFVAEGSYNAMEKMRYYLNLSKNDINSKILSTNSDRCWYMEHCGNTYVTIK